MRVLGLDKTERVLVAFAVPCAWTILLFFARYVLVQLVYSYLFNWLAYLCHVTNNVMMMMTIRCILKSVRMNPSDPLVFSPYSSEIVLFFFWIRMIRARPCDVKKDKQTQTQFTDNTQYKHVTGDMT